MFNKIHWRILGGYLLVVVLMAASLNVFMVESLKNRTIAMKSDNLIASTRLMAADISTHFNHPDYISLLSREYGQKYQVRVVVFDRQGVVVGDSLNDEQIMGRKLDYQELKMALQGKSRARTHLLPSGQWVMYAASPIMSGNSIQGAVLTSSLANDIYDLIYDVRIQIFWLSVIVLLLVGFVAFHLSAMITRPISKLSKAARRVSQGGLGLQVSVKNSDEIGELVDSFNAMSTKLQQVDEKRRKFFHNASHELKTPLAAAILLTDSILYDIENGRTPPYEFLQDIKQQLQRLESLVQDLSDLARLDDAQPADRQEISLLEIGQKVEATLRPLGISNNIDIYLEADEVVDYQLIGNPAQLTEAIMNIGENAVKYSEPGGQVIIKLINKGQSLVIKVIDNGIGIPDQDIEHVFDRFYRVDKARSRDLGGSGLGLSIAREIVEAHGGSINIYSKVGQGTTVKVELPVEKR